MNPHQHSKQNVQVLHQKQICRLNPLLIGDAFWFNVARHMQEQRHCKTLFCFAQVPISMVVTLLHLECFLQSILRSASYGQC
jgi:hypothetical protein